MFSSSVCLILQTWCQLLNLSAADNEDTPGDDVFALRSGTLLAVPEYGSTDHSPEADWDTKIKGATLNPQGTASGGRFSQQKLFAELKDYKLVIPHVLSGKQKRSVAVLLQRNYANHVGISVQLDGEDLMLDLRRNKLLLPRGFQVSHYDSNGTLVTEQDTELYHCYYEGSVRSYPGSQVSASTCSGLSALVVLSNRTYVIEHLEGDKLGRHLIYRPEDLKSVPSRCGVTKSSPELTLTEHLQRSQRMKRDVLQETRHIEMVLVADNILYQYLDFNKDAVVRRLINTANTVDLYYRPFNIRVALIGAEVWTTDQIIVDKNAHGTLNRFLRWRKTNLLPRLYNDNAHLILGGIFTGGTAGLASFGAICSSDQSGGVDLDTRPSFLGAAAILAHELGHNLGISHDTESRNCDCPDRDDGCIMEEAIGFDLPKQFSSCSRKDLMTSLGYGFGMCLYNVPRPDMLVGGTTCGNLYVEKGEECDCGLPEDCSDPCCNPSTCKLIPGAECPSSGACCKNCKLVSAGSVCRLVMGECDLPEVCTGTSSDCPSNTYVKDGHPCGNGNIYCSTGVCQSADKQCQEIWGEGAVSAETICYEVTNSQGSVYGNCGRNQNDEYIKCTDQDAVCGKIQCKGGNEKPIQGGVLNSVTTSLDYRGVHYECRGTSITSGDASSTDLVRQGTKCGDNKVCIDAKCQDVALLNVESCDETCNGHGACNNNDNCHCDMGWDPPYCQTSGRGGSIDSGTVIGTRTTPTPETREANTTRLQQTTREITAPTPETREANTTRLQQTTREITGRPDRTTLVASIVVTILSLLFTAAFITWLLVKKGIICSKATTSSPATHTSTRSRESKFLFVSDQDVVHIQRAEIAASIGLQHPLPNTIV